MSQFSFYIRTHKIAAFEVRLNHQLYVSHECQQLDVFL
jgi:hypothetical protein